MKFEEFNLHEDVLAGIKDAGFEACMPVQEATLKETLQGKDVTVQSQTGSGKTAAFLVTIFQRWCTTKPEERRSTMIISPTRELAVQIEDEAKLLGAHMGMNIGCFYGGVGYKQQEEALKKGVDLYIGTPGRLIDFGQNRKIDFTTIGTVVIDEADRLFDMGFYPDIRRMLKMMGPREKRMTMLFSATLGTKVLNVAWEHMNMPVEVSIEPEHITVREITQELYHVEGEKKFSLMLGLLKKYDPPNAIIFTNMKVTAVEVAKRLSRNGYAAKFLMGDLPQKKRLSTIDRVKHGEIRFLVATDVAARGLHVDDLAMVINYDIPEDPESYVHRIGRTARAGKSGRAITLACERYVYGLEPIEQLLEQKIPVEWADDALFLEDKSAGIDFRSEYRRASSSGTRSKGRAVPQGTKGRRKDSGGRDTHRGQASATPRRSAASPQRSNETGRRSNQTKKHSGPKSRSNNRKPATAGRPSSAPSERKERKPQYKNPDRKAPVEKRLEMYRQKYGEDFKVVSLTSNSKEAGKKKQKKSIISRIKRKLFKK
jgi:ATP-dependent RNA helicase RhlB